MIHLFIIIIINTHINYDTHCKLYCGNFGIRMLQIIDRKNPVDTGCPKIMLLPRLNTHERLLVNPNQSLGAG